MPDLSFVFDGIGSTLIGIVLTALVAGPAGYALGRRSITQKQKARDNANQTQVGTSNER